ncbi:MAG: DUF1848 domain-containing protein [Desulfobacterota bacterium]|nr:DUF1848 domain-containing protein [Thermodesulfobacteriota bacterium]
MIISASRRTDIPAFYSNWFMERIREGWVEVKNPFNPSQKKLVSLQPEKVEAIIFWTRNVRPLLPYLKELDKRGYHYVFLYTITGYGPLFEKKSPPLQIALDDFRRLSDKIGPERVTWRFDPIIYLTEKGTEWVIECFDKIIRVVAPNTDRVIVSFLDFYKKVKQRLQKMEKTTGLKIIDPHSQSGIIEKIASELAERARINNLRIFSCAEKEKLTPFGIKPGSCIDGEKLNKIFNLTIEPEKDKHQRLKCRCTVSQDIGEYKTCRHGCIYCYAI